MTTITAPLTSITLAALVPDVVRSCVVLQPSPPPDPGEEPPAPVTGPGIYTPIAPGVTYANLPIAPTIVDTSPDQMIGCIVTVADNPQGRLNALFPSAVDGDGVIDRATNDIWVYDGATWNNVGPTPGPTITATTVIPPWNETLLAVARTRTKLSVNALAYALQLLTEPDPITTTTALTVRSVAAYISVPSADFGLTAQAPDAAGPPLPQVPLTTLTLSALAPTINDGRVTIAAPSDFVFTVLNPAVYDPDAAKYIREVETADTQSLEHGVKEAINTFVVGCKSDNIWSAIKASCILAGARTLDGALTPLVGAAPTSFNFVAGDYNRETGLIGNASTKYLDTNRGHQTDPRDSRHLACYVSALSSSNADGDIMGSPFTTTGWSYIVSRTNSSSTPNKYEFGLVQGTYPAGVTRTAGFVGCSRSNSSSLVGRAGGASATYTAASQTPNAGNVSVFRASAGTSSYVNARLAFYSVGESLDLALLDARVTQLITDIASAIP